MAGRRPNRRNTSSTTNNNNNNGGRNQSSTPQQRNPVTCRKCGRIGHKQADCRSAQSQAGGNSNAPRQNKHCDNHPGLNNHTTAECKLNSNRSSRREDRDGDIGMEGFAFTNAAAAPTSNATYCAGCNSKQHNRKDCPDIATSAIRLEMSHEVCWKCDFRGHTGDECENPIAKVCIKCHTSGHDTAQCKNTSTLQDTRAKFDAGLMAKERMRWKVINEKGEPVEIRLPLAALMQQKLDAEIEKFRSEKTAFSQAQLAYLETRIENAKRSNLLVSVGSVEADVLVKQGFALTPRKFGTFLAETGLTSGPTFTVRTDNNVGMTHLVGNRAPSISVSRLGGATRARDIRLERAAQRLEEEDTAAELKDVRAKIDRSKQLYKKFHANSYVRSMYTTLLEQGMITQQRLSTLQMAFADKAMLQFWRDPDAMNALAFGMKAVCNSCSNEATIVDKRFQPSRSGHRLTCLPSKITKIGGFS